MSFFVSKEIKEIVSLEDNQLNNNKDFIEVKELAIDNKHVKLFFISNNEIKKEFEIDKFIFSNKEYNFSEKIKFKLCKLKKENTKLLAEIIISEEIFWRYLENEK